MLEKHWAGARNKKMKGALTLFAQDSESKLILYTDADIKGSESDDQVLEFLSFWKGMRRGVKPTLVFDSKFTSYAKLSKLNADHDVKFITLRRRGKNLIEQASRLDGWRRIHIPHDKRKYPNPQVHESVIELRDYEGEVRQVIVRGNGKKRDVPNINNLTVPSVDNTNKKCQEVPDWIPPELYTMSGQEALSAGPFSVTTAIAISSSKSSKKPASSTAQ